MVMLMFGKFNKMFFYKREKRENYFKEKVFFNNVKTISLFDFFSVKEFNYKIKINFLKNLIKEDENE